MKTLQHFKEEVVTTNRIKYWDTYATPRSPVYWKNWNEFFINNSVENIEDALYEAAELYAQTISEGKDREIEELRQMELYFKTYEGSAYAGFLTRKNKDSIIEQERRESGYVDHYNPIDARVAEETLCRCKACMRYIGLKKIDPNSDKTWSYVAIAHCDRCGNEYEF